MDVRAGLVIDAIVFTTNIRTFPRVGGMSYDLQISVTLNGLLYFIGALKDYTGIRVSQLAAHRGTCEDP